jgi:hypothetical protein
MASLVVELPTQMVKVDEDRFSDLDRSLILEHLKYYFSRFEPLPAVTVRLVDQEAFVVAGHKYVAAAVALGRPRLRAIVDPASDGEAVSRLLALDGVQRLDLDALEKEEARNPVPLAWHIVFFGRPLTPEQRTAFSKAMGELAGSTRGSPPTVAYDESGTRAELRMPTPVFDHDWATDLLRALSDFHEAHTPIVSYQGRAFLG